jgi:hypothetical protein
MFKELENEALIKTVPDIESRADATKYLKMPQNENLQ